MNNLSSSDEDRLTRMKKCAIIENTYSVFKVSVIDLCSQGIEKQQLIGFINNAYSTMEVEEDGQLEFNFKEGI